VPTPPLYSVLIPVFNSEKILPETVRQTAQFFEARGLRYEILLVDDGSRDGSWQRIEELARTRAPVVGIRLLKNSGQHRAVYCAIQNARGDFLITMDDDLQNPPGEIGHLIDKIGEGHDVVFARFKKKRHSLTRRLGSRIIGALNAWVFDKPAELTLTNFRIFTSDVAERVRNYHTVYPYIPGLLLLCSSRVANVETEHHPRSEGQSNYGLIQITRLVAALLFNYSSFPLKLLTTVGFAISFASFGVGVYFLAKSLLVGTRVPGFPSLAVLLSFLNGFIIVMLGVMGEYLTRIVNQLSLERPYYVREIVGR